MLGCGTVGAAVARILLTQRDEIARRAGLEIDLVSIGVRDIKKARPEHIPPGLVRDDVEAMAADPSLDVLIETIGGTDPAKRLILEALARGKHVVTANKELIASDGVEIMSAAEASGTSILFEGSVAAGIPIVRPIKESLAGDRVSRVIGILNGTTNFMLTRMSDTGESFDEALAEADRLGFTEADPSADIDAHDAASKLAILASLAFDVQISADDVAREGIRTVSQADISAAHELGYEVKLVAVADVVDGEVSARVHPAMLPRTHPLASVREELNAVFVEAAEAGEIMFLGRGAGGAPTASAVVGDVVEAARNAASGIGDFAYPKRPAALRPPERSLVRYYLVLSVRDEPGVLAGIAGVFGRHGVSIASLRQEGSGDEATLVLITHAAPEKQHGEVFERLSDLESVKEVRSHMRVLGTAEG